MDAEKGRPEVGLQDVFQATFDPLDLGRDPVLVFAIDRHHPLVVGGAGGCS
jgi:hypothetical protein